MRIAILGPYIIDTKIKGGVERHIKNIVNEFNNCDLEIHIFSITKSKKNETIKIKPNIILHTIKSIRMSMTITGITFDSYNLIKEVNKIKPDLIHGQMVGAPYGFSTYLLARKYPSILTIHTLIYQNFKVRRALLTKFHDILWHFLEKIEIKNIPNIITVSEHLNPEIVRMGGSKIYYIPNGINKEWLGIESKITEGRILLVGRIIPIKGHDSLIKAIHYIKSKNIEVCIHIVGPSLDIDYFNRLKRLIAELNISDNVKFLGLIPDEELLKEYSECQIFVLPSHEESNPFVLIEAMAAGKPVVANNVGGVPFMINDGENGFLVKDNDVEGMAEKIIYLMNHKDIWKKISDNNREKTKSYLWSSVASQTIEIYKNVINENKC